MDYQSSGVNIDAGNRAVSLIKDKVRDTFTPGVLGDLGGFAGFSAGVGVALAGVSLTRFPSLAEL